MAEQSQEELVQALYQYTADLMSDGLSESDIEAKLQEKGLDAESASMLVRNVMGLRSKAMRAAGKRDMIYGALWCIGGILVTVITFLMASGGGTYVVTWGAIIFGAVQFFRGLSRLQGQ